MKKDELRTPVSQRPHVIESTHVEKGIGENVSVFINDKKITVPFGTSILDACRENQIHVPTLL